MRNHQMIQRTGAHSIGTAESVRKKLNRVPVPVKATPHGVINGLLAACTLRRNCGIGHVANPSGRLMAHSRATFTAGNKTTGIESMSWGSILKEPIRTIPLMSDELGLLLMDSSLNPISWNDEAIQILSYPEMPQGIKGLDVFLARTIQARLLNYQSLPSSPCFLTEFTSGRRRYRSWLFHLHRQLRGPSEPMVIELVLERNAPELPTLSLIAKQFNISRRERQTLEWLSQGLSSKEIADRMKISSHTVNSFIRTIMIKMGVSNRSGILGKLITTSSTRDSSTPQQPGSEQVE